MLDVIQFLGGFVSTGTSSLEVFDLQLVEPIKRLHIETMRVSCNIKDRMEKT